ncbi:hypothetical protein CBL_11057 [Carabus blaptoides fortunei]
MKEARGDGEVGDAIEIAVGLCRFTEEATLTSFTATVSIHLSRPFSLFLPIPNRTGTFDFCHGGLASNDQPHNVVGPFVMIARHGVRISRERCIDSFTGSSRIAWPGLRTKIVPLTDFPRTSPR